MHLFWVLANCSPEWIPTSKKIRVPVATHFSQHSVLLVFFFLFGKRTCAKLCLTVVLIFFSDDQQNWESFYGYWSLAFSSSVNYLMFFAHTILG